MVSVLFGINEEYFCENEFAERRRVKMSGVDDGRSILYRFQSHLLDWTERQVASNFIFQWTKSD